MIHGGWDSPLFYDELRGHLLRKLAAGERFPYQLLTTAFAGGRLQSLLPCDDPGFGVNDRPADLAPLLQVPRLPHLVAMARKWVAASGTPAPTIASASPDCWNSSWATRAGFNIRWKGNPATRASTRSRISWPTIPAGIANTSPPPGPDAPQPGHPRPRRPGATAATSGTAAGKCYQVRQSDAHAWVEAHLAAGDIPPEMHWGNDDERWEGGHGSGSTPRRRLPKSPATPPWTRPGRASTGSIPFGTTTLWKWIGSARRRPFIKPAGRHNPSDGPQSVQCGVVGPQTARIRRPSWNLSRWNGLGGWLLHVGLPCCWRGAGRLAGGPRPVATGAATLAASFPVGRPAPARRLRPRIEFYRRFQGLLARQGLVRAAGQTPRELARRAAERIVTDTGRQDLAAVPGRIVDAFYRVRFGGLPLDNPHREAVEHGCGIEAPPPHRAAKDSP